MSKYILAVHSNPTQGNEKEYNDWYDNVHLGEVLKVPGFVAAQRFKASDDVDPIAGGPPAHSYLAIYELDTEDPRETLNALSWAAQNGMTMSDAIDTANVAASLYGPITERVTA